LSFFRLTAHTLSYFWPNGYAPSPPQHSSFFFLISFGRKHVFSRASSCFCLLPFCFFDHSAKRVRTFTISFPLRFPVFYCRPPIILCLIPPPLLPIPTLLSFCDMPSFFSSFILRVFQGLSLLQSQVFVVRSQNVDERESS